MRNLKCGRCGVWFDAGRTRKNPLCPTCRRNAKRDRQRKARAELRAEVLKAYGGKCSCPDCGQTEEAFLSIEHLGPRGVGNKHRKQVGGAGDRTYADLKRRGFPPGYTVLCLSCNFVKASRGECVHVTRRRLRDTLAAMNAALGQGVPKESPEKETDALPETKNSADSLVEIRTFKDTAGSNPTGESPDITSDLGRLPAVQSPSVAQNVGV